jgi:hypothetical protein
VARRYTRAAFPDEFNRRLDSQARALERLLKSTDARLVTAIFVETSDQELPAGVPYRLDVRITAETWVWQDSNTRRQVEAFGERLDGLLSDCEGIALDDIATIPEDDFTLAQLRVYKRLDVNCRSLPDDTACAVPPEQADSP